MLFEPIQVALDHGNQRRIDHRGAGALVFADFRVYLGGQADHDVRGHLRNELVHLLLVGGIEIGVEKADRDGGHALIQKLLDGGFGLGLIERQRHFASAQDALSNFETPLARHQRRQAIPIHIVDIWPPLTAHFQFVAKALSGQQAGDCSRVLDHRVGRNGRAVDNVFD